MKADEIKALIPTEAELCAIFIRDMNAQDGWVCYPETGGFDILAVHESGRQIGVEAKLILNAKVADQIFPTDGSLRYSDEGPDHRLVIVRSITDANAGIARLPNGMVMREVMDREQVELVRAASRSKDGGPWSQWWGEMARKTVIRRLAKRLPILDPAVSDTIGRDDELYDFAAGNAQDSDTAPAQDQPATTPKGPRRPRGLDAVAAAASQPATGHDDSVIDGEVVDRETGEVIQPDGTGSGEPATDDDADF